MHRFWVYLSLNTIFVFGLFTMLLMFPPPFKGKELDGSPTDGGFTWVELPPAKAKPPLYGGCKEWRPAYGPKPKACRPRH